jgi:hypothetical protein
MEVANPKWNLHVALYCAVFYDTAQWSRHVVSHFHSFSLPCYFSGGEHLTQTTLWFPALQYLNVWCLYPNSTSILMNILAVGEWLASVLQLHVEIQPAGSMAEIKLQPKEEEVESLILENTGPISILSTPKLVHTTTLWIAINYLLCLNQDKLGFLHFQSSPHYTGPGSVRNT